MSETGSKFAAYTDDTIWSVEDSEADARTEGEATMREMGSEGRIGEIKIAPIDEDLVASLESAEASGQDVLFDLIDGELCEVETVES